MVDFWDETPLGVLGYPQSAAPGRSPRRFADVPLPVYLTPQQIADKLQVHERTVLRWAQEDASMPATRIWRVIRFEREALLRWLARKRPRSAKRGPKRDRTAHTGPAGRLILD